MENEKYKRIETLIGIMKETFGSEVEEVIKQKAEEEEAASRAAKEREAEELGSESGQSGGYSRAGQHKPTL